MAGEDRRINVGLSFTADTSKARQELDKLKNDLNKITTQGFSGEKITTPLQQSVEYAGELKAMLDAATDAGGKLNLSKFSNELTKSGKTLADFNNVITTGGKEGVAVMNSLAQQIRSADANATILSGTLKKFFDGLKNTAMWTIQSNAIHTVESALSGAYNYAQKLNKGLTDIAIVSDLNTKQLAEFARTANQMAKELSASTSEYVSGALIYYQAGLSDEEVIERTNTTIKLAETSGETAEAISSYMTAIWNNFYDGSKSVEYYADAISYLGAVTAASNADIAEGMQAFSAVADTVGLSFEYGASALTLLRDITQQSASTIGNSLKTIFARLSSVAQGESLEDGVDLTKYSKALEQVGVSVLDATGNLRQMDDILDDLGARWDSLNEAQKVALAQTVGGVRQYNNLISLMDNYEQFQELVSEASGSEGYLNHQAEIYAESWEAAANRVEAAWQGLYQQLIDDKFFIALTNGLAGIVNGITKIVDGLGGIWGLLPAIASLYFTIGKDSSINGLLKIRNTTQEIIYNLREARKDNQNNQLDAAGILLQNTTSAATTNTTLQYYDRLTEKLDFLRDHQNSMTKAQISMFEQDIERIKQVINYLGELDEKIVANELSFMELENRYGVDSGTTDKAKTYSRYAKAFQDIGDVRSDFDLAKEMANEYLTKDNLISSVSNKYTGGKELLQKIANASVHEIDDLLKQFETYLKQGFQDIQDTVKLDALETRLTEIEQGNTSEDDVNRIATLNAIKQEILAEDQAIVIQEQKMGDLTEEQKQDLKQQKQELDAIAKRYEELAKNDTNFSQQRESARATARGLLGDKSKEAEILDQEKWAQSIQSVLRFSTSITTLGTSFNRLWDSIASGKADLGTITGALMGLGSSIVSLLNMTKTLSGMGGILGWLGTGPHMAIIISAVLALVAGFKWLKKAQEDAYAQSTEGQIEANNKALEKQKEIVKNLANEYSNLQSTINDLTSTYENLQKAANEYGIGSPQYLLALEEYKQKLEEIEEKYGDVFAAETDENGIKVIDNNKLAAAKLQEYRTAQAQLLIYQNTGNELRQQKTREDLTDKNKGIATSYDQTVYDAEKGKYVTVTKTDRTVIDGKSVFTIEDALWNQILNDINSGLKQLENGEIKQFDLEQLLQQYEIDPASAVGKYFVNLFKEYIDATEAVENNYNFGDFVKRSKATDIFAWTGYNGIDDSAVVNTLNSIIGQAIGEIDENNLTVEQQEYKTAGMGDWMSSHHYKYDNNGKIIDENGNPVTELPTTEQLITSGAWADYLVQLENGNEKLINQLLNSLNLSDEQREAYYKFQNDQQQFADDTKRAKDLGFDPEEYREYVEYLQSINEELKENQELADMTALANMRLNRGVETLSDNIAEWTDIITTATKEGNEWSKWNIDYANAMVGIREALEDIANTDLSAFTDDDIIQHFDLIQKAATGNVDAIDELIHILAIDYINSLNLTKEQISELSTAINDIDFNKLNIGDHIDTNIETQPFFNALAAMIESGGIAVDKINDVLSQIHYSPIIEWKTVKATHYTHDEGAANGTIQYLDENGKVVTATVMHNSAYNNIQGESEVQIPIIKSGENAGQVATAQNTAKALSASVFTGGTGKYTSSTNRNKGTAKSSSGGSSKKSKEVDTTRYHEINSKLEQTSHYLDMVNTAEDRAYGQSKLDLIEEKIKLLEREAEQYKELYEEAKRYYDSDRDRLANQYGAQFNPDGSIANYDEWYKKYVDKYNAGGMDDDSWSKFEDAISKYEDSLKHLNDAEKKYQDDLNKIFDAKLDAIEYRLKTLNKLIDQDISYLDYMIKQLDKDMYETAEVLALMGQKAGDIYQQALNERDAIISILSLHGLSDDEIEKFINGQANIADILEKIGDLTEAEVEDLLEHQSALLKYNETLIQIREESYAKIGESIDEFNEKIEHQIDIINDLDGVMKHYKNIVDIVGKDILGISDAMLKELDQLSVTAAKSVLEINTAELEKNKAALEELYKRRHELEEAGLEEDLKLLDQEIEAQEDRVRQLSESWASAFEEALQVAQEAFTNTVQRATDAFDKAVAGAMGNLNNLQDMFDKQKTLDDLYLDDYEKIYELNKLNRDILKAMDDTDNIAGKERLLDLQKEINDAQAAGTQLSQYDVEFMQKRLELEMARIALEEAQNAKNMVRMTRDNEGNWSYTYTADATATAEAKQAYEDKLYELEKLNQTHIKDTQDLMLNLLAQYRDEIAKLDVSEAERVQMLEDYWNQLQDEYGLMLNKALADGAWITDTFGVYDHQLIDGWDETLLYATTGFETLEDYLNNFKDASDQMVEATTKAYTQWGLDYEDIFIKAGTDTDNFKDKLLEDMSDVEKAMVGDGDENKGAVGAAKEFADKMKDIFDEILTNLDKWFSGENGYSSKINNIANKNEILYQSIQNLIEQYHSLQKAAEDAANSQSRSGSQGSGGAIGGSNGGSGSSGVSSGSNNPEPATASKKYWGAGYYYIDKGEYWDMYYAQTPGYGTYDEYLAALTHAGVYHKGSIPATMKNAKQRLARYNTGGYTGAWGPGAKLAMLHEKELVLNKVDTENLLTTVGFVRDLTRMISLNAASASSGLGNLFMGGVGQGGGYLDQTVTIHAEFPNATNHSEIEEAFSNLIGLASQYAGRKR